MLKNKLLIVGIILVVSFSSCGIFKKGCGCPPVSKVKTIYDARLKDVV